MIIYKNLLTPPLYFLDIISYHIIRAVYKLCLLAYGVSLSVSIRSIPLELNESGIVALSMYNTCVAGGVAAMLYILLQPSATITFLLLTLAIWLVVTSIVALFMIPKFMKIRKDYGLPPSDQSQTPAQAVAGSKSHYDNIVLPGRTPIISSMKSPTAVYPSAFKAANIPIQSRPPLPSPRPLMKQMSVADLTAST